MPRVILALFLVLALTPSADGEDERPVPPLPPMRSSELLRDCADDINFARLKTGETKCLKYIRWVAEARDYADVYLTKTMRESGLVPANDPFEKNPEPRPAEQAGFIEAPCPGISQSWAFGASGRSTVVQAFVEYWVGRPLDSKSGQHIVEIWLRSRYPECEEGKSGA